MTEVLHLDPVYPDAQILARAADCLRAGGLVAFPTETVYGLGVDALNTVAVARLFAAKQRPASDPLIVHVSTASAIVSLVAAQPPSVAGLAARFWPGPLTMILPRAATVPVEVTAGLNSVALRVPAHPTAQALLQRAGIPVAAPSANLFSRPSPTTAAHVLEDLDGRIDLIVDAGPTPVGVESTVLDLSASRPTVLRHGAVTLEELREVLPGVIVDTDVAISSAGLPSPGLLPRHYAPQSPLTLYTGEPSRCVTRIRSDAAEGLARGEQIGILVAAGDRARLTDLEAVVSDLGADNDLQQNAARLYAALRELDRLPLDRILARDISGTDGLAPAIRDRLRRAADGRVVTC
jgi:L-threonylcarbamoyladenylate synthase